MVLPVFASFAARSRFTSSLKKRLSAFLGTEDTILYQFLFLTPMAACFETLLDAEDAVISGRTDTTQHDRWHPALQAARFRYRNGDMDDLEAKLKESASARHRLICHGWGLPRWTAYFAKLDKICDLGRKV